MNDDALSTVVFDLDGTLVHSLFGLTLSLNRLLARLGRAPLPEAAVRRMVGEGAAKLVERAMGASGAPRWATRPGW